MFVSLLTHVSAKVPHSPAIALLPSFDFSEPKDRRSLENALQAGGANFVLKASLELALVRRLQACRKAEAGLGYVSMLFYGDGMLPRSTC